jgi:uncharacterized protein
MKKLAVSILCFALFCAGCGLSEEEQAKVNSELIEAARSGNMQRLNEAIDGKAQLNAVNEDGQSALYAAIARSDMDMVQLLLEKGAAVSGSEQQAPPLLIMPAYSGHIPLLTLLLEKGSDVNQTNEEGNSALIAAAAAGKSEAVRLLLDKGADINAANKQGMTPLLSACGGMASFELIELLIEKGADVNARLQEKDYSPLMIAASEANRGSNRHIMVAQILNDNGADLEAIHPDQPVTALTFAARKGDIELVELLIEEGAKP